jgi:hypothetical protein
MALFGRLLRLHGPPVPREDFFTEVFAGVLQAHPELAANWFAGLLGRPLVGAPTVTVSTQFGFGRLEDHFAGSRPDLIATLSDEGGSDVVVLESKLGSGEGLEQLRRYAAHLSGIKNARERVLVYATRDPDPKDGSAITAGLPCPVRFLSLRWYEVYRFFATRQQSTLICEMLSFMEEEGMDQANQFSAVDAIALGSLHRALKLMRESLRGPVEQRLIELFGGVRQYSTAMTQLHDHNRFILHQWMEPGRWWCGVGYFLHEADPSGYPLLGLIVEVDPRSPQRAEIMSMMEAVYARGGWERQRWQPGAWSAVLRLKSLRELMPNEDHVAAAREFFLQLLDDVATIQAEFPHLPWTAAETDTEQDVQEEPPRPLGI